MLEEIEKIEMAGIKYIRSSNYHTCWFISKKSHDHWILFCLTVIMTSSYNIQSIYFLSLSDTTIHLLVIILEVPLDINLELWLWHVDTESMLPVLGIENDGVL